MKELELSKEVPSLFFFINFAKKLSITQGLLHNLSKLIKEGKDEKGDM